MAFGYRVYQGLLPYYEFQVEVIGAGYLSPKKLAILNYHRFL